MNADDRKYFDGKFGFIDQRIDNLSEEVDVVKRGVYGDEKNSVPGLIQNSESQNKRIKVLEEIKKRFVWIAGGVLLVIEAIHYAKELL